MKKSHFFGFRCPDDRLADLLEGEENRSETIVRALLEHFSRKFRMTCPTCEGTGEVYNPIRKQEKDGGKSRQLKEKRDMRQ